ncbi:MAG: hypothetical protein IJ583_06965 [Firmicutes bacterium]|nr:hypothetical protein [Bacillota bacterium]
MPRNQFQRMVFAFITVLITVHAYVFYSIYVINGDTLMQITGESSVLDAVDSMGGIMMCSYTVPIWAVVVTEFCLAYLLENVLGSPLSFKLAIRLFNPEKNHPVIFETAIICATVSIMCPAMSLIAAFLYYPYYMGFNIFTLLANWLKLICYNFPFAFFSQLFFIQPAVRTIFRFIFRKDIEKQARENANRVMPKTEIEAIENIYKRIDEIKEELKSYQN